MIRKSLIAIGLVAFAAAPALAIQTFDGPAIGTRLGKRVKAEPLADERLAALGGHDMARCLVNKRGRHVTDLLSSVDAASAAKARTRMMGEIECFNSELGNHLVEGRSVEFPRDVLRGMLAERVLKSETAALAKLPALPREKSYQRPWFNATFRHLAVDEMATCLSETAPAATAAVLSTEPYSTAEGRAFGALMPAMGPCLTVGATLQANRQALRAALADALYQRLHASTAAPAPTGSAQ